MEKSKTGKRKTKLFSVSFRVEELAELEEYLKDMKRQTGFELSRNELIRRAALAHARFKKPDPDFEANYDEAFKSTT